MKNSGYIQCKLVRKTTSGEVVLVSFIPANFAVVGNYLKLKEDNEWIDGWKVVYVGEFSENPPDIKKAIRKHRHNTGDSLPK